MHQSLITMNKHLLPFITFLVLFLITVSYKAQYGDVHMLIQNKEFGLSPMYPPYDFDADGDIDIVSNIWPYETTDILLLQNDSARHFTIPTAHTYDFASESYHGSIDMDNNGLGDLIFSNLDFSMGVKYQTSPGVYSANSSVAGAPYLFATFVTAFEDFDDDQLPDIVSYENNFLYFNKNIGGTSMARVDSIDMSFYSAYPTIAQLDDVNADTYKDYIYTYYTDESFEIRIFENMNGDFLENPDTLSIPVVPDPFNNTKIEFRDLNGDNLPDLVLILNQVIYTAINLGGFEFDTPIPLTSPGYQSYVVADFDNDGDNDMMTSANTFQFYMPQTELYINDGIGNFAMNTIGNSSLNLFYHTPADLDNDGLLDVLATDGVSSGVVFILWNNGNNLFTEPYLQNVHSFAVGNVWTYTAGNITNNNHFDIVASTYSGAVGALVHWEIDPQNPQVALQEIWHTNPLGDLYSYVLGGYETINKPVDLDEDGDMDLVIYTQSTNTLAWMENSGDDKYFTTHEFGNIVWTGNEYFDLLDMDEDTDLDFVILNPGEQVQVQTNLPGSELDQPTVIFDISQNLPNKVIDLDGDGDQDLIGGSADGTQGLIFENTGGGVFAEPITFSSNAGVYGPFVSMSDFNADGIADFVFNAPDSLEIWTSQNSFNYAKTRIPSLLSNTFFHMRSSDADADGDTDVLLCNDGVWILENENGILQSEMPWHGFNDGATETHSFSVADVDADGDEDLIVGRASMFYWVENIAASPTLITGMVYYDENESASYDLGELLLQNTEVNIAPTNVTLFTNELGRFVYQAPNEGEYTIHVDLDENLWTSSNGLSDTTINVLASGGSVELSLGYTDILGIDSILATVSSSQAICNTVGNIWLSFTNSGTTTPDLVYELELAPGLYFDAMNNIPTDSIVGNKYYWHYNDIIPTLTHMLNVQVVFPPVNIVPDNMLYSVLITYVYDEVGNVSDTLVSSFTSMVFCAYDPNDKTELNGWSDEGYMLPNGEMEYLIRFQNTGNYPATDVRIEDPLSDLLDASTLHPVAWSHPMWTEIDADNKVIFHFDNIMLPDSTADLAGSQGFVRFRIHPAANLAPGTDIENTAYIYFDLNEAIVTNTEVNTIFNCTPGSISILNETAICENAEFIFSTLRFDFETYNWTINTTSFEGIEFAYTPTTLEEQTLLLTATNPICTLQTELVFTPSEQPVFNDIYLEDVLVCDEATMLFVSGNGNVVWTLPNNTTSQGFPVSAEEDGTYTATLTNECGAISQSVNLTLFEMPQVGIGQLDGVLFALNDNEQYQWFLEGAPIVGATGPDYVPTETGNYSLLVTFANGCSNISELLFVEVGINENNLFPITISPNPMSNFCTINVPKGLWQMQLIDATGRVVYRVSANGSAPIILERKQLPNGIYTIQLLQNNLLHSTKLVIE